MPKPIPTNVAATPTRITQPKPVAAASRLAASAHDAPKPNHLICWRTSPADLRARTITPASATAADTAVSAMAATRNALTTWTDGSSGSGASGSSIGPRYGQAPTGSTTATSTSAIPASTGTIRQRGLSSRPSGNSTMISGANAGPTAGVQVWSQDAMSPPARPGWVTSAETDHT